VMVSQLQALPLVFETLTALSVEIVYYSVEIESDSFRMSSPRIVPSVFQNSMLAPHISSSFPISLQFSTHPENRVVPCLSHALVTGVVTQRQNCPSLTVPLVRASM